MTSNLKLAQRVKEVLLNGTWIANTNFKDQITNINWQQATHKVANVNTIALLTFHITYYLKGLNNVFKGGDLEIRDKYSFDMPEIKNESDWNELVNDFLDNATFFIDHIASLSEETLDKPFVDEKYGTYIRNIEGVIEHSYYHLGQVALLRKMIG